MVVVDNRNFIVLLWAPFGRCLCIDSKIALMMMDKEGGGKNKNARTVGSVQHMNMNSMSVLLLSHLKLVSQVRR